MSSPIGEEGIGVGIPADPRAGDVLCRAEEAGITDLPVVTAIRKAVTTQPNKNEPLFIVTVDKGPAPGVEKILSIGTHASFGRRQSEQLERVRGERSRG